MAENAKTPHLRTSFSLDNLENFQDFRDSSLASRTWDDTEFGRSMRRNRASIRFIRTGETFKMIQSCSETCNSLMEPPRIEKYRPLMCSSSPTLNLDWSNARSRHPVLQFHLPFRRFHFDVDSDDENASIREEEETILGHRCEPDRTGDLYGGNDAQWDEPISYVTEESSNLDPLSNISFGI
ncbi:hypothetical protein FS842_002809, partial [Serendipita sp. 407]